MPHIARKIASRTKDTKVLVDDAMSIETTGCFCCTRRVVSFGKGQFFYPEDRTILQVGDQHFEVDPVKASGGEKKYHPADCFETDQAFAYLSFAHYNSTYLMEKEMTREQGYAEQLRQAQWEVYVNKLLKRQAYAMVIGGKVRVLVEHRGGSLDNPATYDRVIALPLIDRIALMQQAVEQILTLAAKHILVTDCSLDNMTVQAGQLSLIDFSGCVEAAEIRLGQRPRKFPYLDTSTRETGVYNQASTNYSLALCFAQLLPEWFEVTKPTHNPRFGFMEVKAKVASESLPLGQQRLMELLAAMIHAKSGDVRPRLEDLQAALSNHAITSSSATMDTGLLSAGAGAPKSSLPTVDAGQDLTTPVSDEDLSDSASEADEMGSVVSHSTGSDASDVAEGLSVGDSKVDEGGFVVSHSAGFDASDVGETPVLVFPLPSDAKVAIYHDGKGLGLKGHEVELSTLYDEVTCQVVTPGEAVGLAATGIGLGVSGFGCGDAK